MWVGGLVECAIFLCLGEPRVWLQERVNCRIHDLRDGSAVSMWNLEFSLLRRFRAICVGGNFVIAARFR